MALEPYNPQMIKLFEYTVMSVLPTVYDDSLSYYEVLNKVIVELNKVIVAMNANNEQVKNLTDFNIQQFENLTQSFNNFTQSITARQENFENEISDRQQEYESRLNQDYGSFTGNLTTEWENYQTNLNTRQTQFEDNLKNDIHVWEQQLLGEIAEWESNTQETFQQQYDKFLADYQKQFGVVQETGTSTTNVMSQNAVSTLFGQTVISKGSLSGEQEAPLNDLNTFPFGTIYEVTVGTGIANRPITDKILTVITASGKITSTKTTGIQICYTFLNTPNNVIFYRMYENKNWTEWIRIYTSNEVVQETGTSTTNAMSQNAVSTLFGQTVISKGSLSGKQEAPLNDLNTFPFGTIYEVTVGTGIANRPITDKILTVITASGKITSTKTTGIQICYTFLNTPNNVIFYRMYENKNWTEWIRIYTSNEVVQETGTSTTNAMSQNAVSTLFGRTVISKGRLSTTVEATAPLDDLNTFPFGTQYEVLLGAGVKNAPTRNVYTVITNTANIQNNPTTGYQVVLSYSDNVIYWRTKEAKVWQNWNTLLKSSDIGVNDYREVITINEDLTEPISFVNKIINGNGHTLNMGIALHSDSTDPIKIIPYQTTETTLLYQVFVGKTLPLSIGSERSTGYYVTIWNGNEKLIPTLSETPNINEFTYRNGNFYINADSNDFIMNDIESSRNGIILRNCNIFNFTVKYCSSSGIRAINCDFNATNVESSYSALGQGFDLDDCSGTLIGCTANYNRNDGFNFHSINHSSFTNIVNCHAHYNFDDGISHHDMCNFSIEGGEYSHNNKGGIASPTFGCIGNIYNAYCHDNGYGIYANADVATNATTNIFGCVLIDNGSDIYLNNYNALLANTKYDTHEGNGQITTVASNNG